MKKLLLLPPIGLVLAVVTSSLIGSFAGASSTTTYCKAWFPATCLYFADSSFGGASGQGSADANVLPDPALKNVLTSANKTQSLIDTMSGYLNSADPHASAGAAFIIDDMLHYNGNPTPPYAADPTLPVGGGIAAGVAYAKTNFNSWASIVNYFGNSTNPADHGINWNYRPPDPSTDPTHAFCGTAANIKYDSAYDDTSSNDGQVGPVIFPISFSNLATCEYEYNASMPIILFYWAGGSFGIGAACGNVEYNVSPVPLNRPPIATISVQCNSGQQSATVSFSDPDAPTNGYITIGADPTHIAVTSGSTVVLPVPPTDPYNVQEIDLWVQDTGPAGSGAYTKFPTNSAAPCVVSTCGAVNLTPDTIDPYMTYALTASVTISSGIPSGTTMSLQITPPAGVTYNPSIPSVATTTSGNTASATFSNLPPTGSPGTFTAHWSLISSGGTTIASCSGTFPVAYMPYVDVYGGDVMVGASPTYNGGGSACETETTAPGVYAGAYGWNQHTTNYTGAGSQYAVFALGSILDFSSALPATSSNTPPSNLAFANIYSPTDPTKLNPSNGLYGGYFGDTSSGDWTGSCDFTSDLTVAATNPGTIAGQAVPLGTQETTYINGHDVYISGNIVYFGGWTKPSDIPLYKLVVVGGNIYINSSVTELDGLYVSEPSGGVGGGIYTCAAAPGVPLMSYASCNTQLVVNGSFVAKKVWLGRTYGSVGQAKATDTGLTNHAAETFIYSPEMWLPRNASPPSTKYQAITGLPPVL